MCAENLLLISVLDASMKTKGTCVMHVQSIMHAVKRCFCRRSTRRERASVDIRVRTPHTSGSHPFRQKRLYLWFPVSERLVFCWTKRGSFLDCSKRPRAGCG